MKIVPIHFVYLRNVISISCENMEKFVNEVAWMKEYELRSIISTITDQLSFNEKIHLIFLMCQKPSEGIQVIDALHHETNNSKKNNLFFKWLFSQRIIQESDVNWKEILAEYLTLLEKFKCIDILGFQESVVLKIYHPKNNFRSKWMSLIRKILFNFTIYINPTQRNSIIHGVNQKLGILKKIPESECLEYELMYWSAKGIINLNEENEIDLNHFISVVKLQGYENWASDMALLVEKTNTKLVRNKVLNQSISDQFEFYSVINENDLGYCVIINEKVFTNPMLSTRYGTEKDVERLMEVFTVFGFDVKVHNNLTYLKLIETLDHYAKVIKKDHSAFILIILSHGSENVIYTTDSQAVDMNTIEMVFQAEICPNLIGKPKIFIVQSCQGDKWQKQCVNNEESKTEILTDSIIEREPDTKKTVTGPQRGDSMIAWSTVRGFASFRDKYNGSWYIEELVKELWRFGDVFDLVEIFTRVNNNLRKKIYGDQFMVPSLLLSLRAKVKFPYLKENEARGKKILLERLIFEKYFEKFLTDYSDSSTLDKFLKIKPILE